MADDTTRTKLMLKRLNIIRETLKFRLDLEVLIKTMCELMVHTKTIFRANRQRANIMDYSFKEG